MSLLRLLLTILGGSAAYTGADLYLGPQAPMATVGGFSFDQATLWAIAGVLVNMYLPDGFLKKIAQTFIKEKSGKVDTELIEKLLDELDDIYPILKELYKKMAQDGAPKEQLAALKTLAMIENEKHFGVDFSE